MTRRPWISSLRLPSRRAAIQALLTAAVIAVFSWYLGTNVWHAILFGGVLTTIAWVCAGLGSGPEAVETDWRETGGPSRAGARSDVVQLSFALRGRRGQVGDVVLGRVHQIARRRLAAYGLELRDPADRGPIEQLIGRRAYRVLGSRRVRSPTLRSLEHCLAALDMLDPTPPTAVAGARRRPPTSVFPLRRRARAR